MGHIFISYSHKDSEYVHKLANALQSEGFEIWIDDRIDYGKTWPKVIQKHLDGCDAFIVVMTENAYKSDWVQNEVTRALRKKKPFFALLLKGETWLSFEAVQYEDVTQGKLPSTKFYDSLALKVSRKEKIEILDNNSQYRLKISFGIAAVIFTLVIIGFAVPQLFRPINIPTATMAINKQTLNSTFTALSPSKTPQPSSTPIETITPTALLQVYDPHPMSGDYHDNLGVPMRLVLAGIFTMGSDSTVNAKPTHQIYLDSYYIDKYEVTNVLYGNCVDVGVCKQPLQIYSRTNNKYFGSSAFNNFPVIYVTWDMAKTYCEWRGVNLPTEAQWEKAARGTDNRAYPWGNDFSCKYANLATCNQDIVQIGEYEIGKSIYGVYDLSGNVAEWVNDYFSYSYYAILPSGAKNPIGPSAGGYKVVRGGSWSSSSKNYGTVFYRSFFDYLDVKYYNDNVGFRCARPVP